MSYKYSKGAQVIGDLKAASDTQRDTLIDFEEDYIGFQASGSVVMVVSGSNVGIGTTSPGCELHVKGDDARVRIDGDSNSHPGLEISENGTRKWIIFNDYGNDNLTFKTNSNTRMSIQQAGNVGIGTTSPIAELDVSGKIAITSESSTPSQPSDGQGYLYTKSDGKLYWRSYDVTETDLTSGGSGGGSSSNRSVYMGYVSLQTTARVVSYDLGANLGGTANNNFKGMIIVPFGGTLDTVILSTKGATVNDTNFGDIVVTAYKNQDNFSSGTAVTVNGDNFSQKASGTPNIYSGVFDFSLSVSQGDLIQIKANRGTGGSTDTLVTVVFTES